jgi:ubiquinol-cytochrome c reductase cytochrome b subunit
VLHRLKTWLDHRTGFRKVIEVLLIEHIPGGARWRYVWGSVLAFVFLIQLVTGVLLMTAYSPGDSTAWSSVYFIQYKMDFGWLIRGLHHFGSQAMVVLLGVHMLQVVIAGAHLPPREINWWLGLALMALVLAMSLTGYLLPWDQKGYYATQVATNIAGNLPVLGPFVQKFIVGGPAYGHHTLTRFYALHVGILPPLIIVLVILHVAVFRRHGVTTPRHATGAGWFWPDQAFKDMLVSMIVFAILLAVVIWGGQGNAIEPPAGEETAAAEEPDLYERWAHAGREGSGANLDAPADPATESYPARPEWYFLALFQLLKYFEGDLEILGTVLIPMGVGLLMFLLPLLGYGPMRKFGHVVGVLVVVGFWTGLATLTYLALADDMTDPVPRWVITKVGLYLVPAAAGVLVLLQGLLGLLGPGGLRRTVSIFGTVLVAALLLTAGGLTYCALSDCLPQELVEKVTPHLTEEDKATPDKTKRFQAERDKADQMAERAIYLADSSDGIPEEGALYLLRRDPLTQGPQLFQRHCATCHSHAAIPPQGKNKPTAPDLTDFGSKEWLVAFLDAPNGPRFLGRVQDKAVHSHFNRMAEWVQQQKADAAKKGPAASAKLRKDFAKVATWLASHPRGRKWDDKPTELKEGFKAFRALNCTSCHRYEPKKEKDFDAPDLTGYGSAEWIRLMIMAPNHARRYGENNLMPAFRDLNGPEGEYLRAKYAPAGGKLTDLKDIKFAALTDVERELILRWLVKDYRVVFGGKPIAAPSKR